MNNPNPDHNVHPVKTIVVGTDGSATSLRAVAQAAQLSAALGADLHVACVVRAVPEVASLNPIGPIYAGNWAEEVEAAAAATAKDAAALAAGYGAGAAAAVLNGEPAHALIDFSDKVGADLLVLGSKGLKGAARFLLGSVPDRCAHHANCSVLIVRTD